VADEKLLEYAARFHGHLGPWLVLGLRAGLYARRVLRAGPFELEAVVTSPAWPPHSCFIDGIQVGSGCTMGKGNITHRAGRSVSVRFSRVASSKRLSLRVRAEVASELEKMTSPETVARALFARPLRRLFVVRRSA